MSDTSEDTTKVPNLLKYLRCERGGTVLTLAEVSAITGQAVSTISRHETGEINLDARAMVAYAKLYKVEIWQLYVKDGNEAMRVQAEGSRDDDGTTAE